jgi:hypothetical protein
MRRPVKRHAGPSRVVSGPSLAIPCQTRTGCARAPRSQRPAYAHRSGAIAPLLALLQAGYRPVYDDTLPPALDLEVWLPK